MMKEAVQLAHQKLLSLLAVLVGAVGDLQDSRGSAQAELYDCTLPQLFTLYRGMSSQSFESLPFSLQTNI